MSTEVASSTKTTQETTTAPPTLQQQALQAISTQAARFALPQLQFQSDYLNAALGVPFNPAPYQNLSRQELGLPESVLSTQQDPNRAERLLANMRLRSPDGTLNNLSMDHDESIALQEYQQQQRAQAQFIERAQQSYGQVTQSPLAQLTQSQIQQELQTLPYRQAAERSQLKQNVAQSDLALRYQNEVAPTQLQLQGQEAQLGLSRFGQLTGPETTATQQGLQQAQVLSGAQNQAVLAGLGTSASLLPSQTQAAADYLRQAGTGASEAFQNQQDLRKAITNLVTGGGVATPEQQAKINQIYNDRQQALEQNLGYGLKTAGLHLVDDLASRRGLIGTPIGDTYGQLQAAYMNQLGQGTLGLSSEAAKMSLDYPLQLANTNVQQQYLNNQSIGQLPSAIGTMPSGVNALYGGSTLNPSASLYPAIQGSMALRQGQPQYFPGYATGGGSNLAQGSGQNAYGPFGVPLGMQGSVIGGDPYAVQAQDPFVRSQLANATSVGTSTGTQSTGGVIPALGAAGSILGGAGSAGTGSALAYGAFCWIARLLYGETAWQVPLLRWYISGPYAQTIMGAWFFQLYLTYGARIADWLKPRLWAQRMAKVWFDHLLRHAIMASTQEYEHAH